MSGDCDGAGAIPGLVHDLNTPLAIIRGTVELLRDDDAMPPAQRTRFLDNALADLDRLSNLVGGLLRLARAEEGFRSQKNATQLGGALVTRARFLRKTGELDEAFAAEDDEQAHDRVPQPGA